MNYPLYQKAPKAEVLPYKIQQAIIGLENHQDDVIILRYLNQLFKRVPTEAAYFFHAVPSLENYPALFYKDTKALGSMEKLREEITRQLKEAVSTHLPNAENTYTEFELLEGNPLSVLLDFAEEEDADLVVIGQQGQKKRHGILSRHLSRLSKSNVLIVPDQTAARFKKILVPIDFSANSGKALQAAVGLMMQVPEIKSLECLHVWAVPEVNYFEIGEEFEQNMIDQIQEAFDLFIEDFIPEQKHLANLHIIRQDVWNVSEIIEGFAYSNLCDLVVIGAKGHSKVERMMYGSITEDFLSSNQTFPVLIVKP